MNKKNVNRLLGGLAVSAIIASPLATAAENPFLRKDLGAAYQLAEVVPPATPKAEAPNKGKEEMCARMKGMMDGNKDGKVSKEEFLKHHEDMFGMMDKNKDGVLDDTEMGQMSDMMKNMGGMSGMGGMMHGGGMGGMGGMDHGGQGGGMEGMKHDAGGAAKP